MKLSVKLLPLAMVIFSLFISGCVRTFTEIDSDALKNILDDSKNHSAVSFWYLGEKNGFHYIVEKWPSRTIRYKIMSKYVRINIDHPLSYTENKDEWINLGYSHIIFGDDFDGSP